MSDPITLDRPDVQPDVSETSAPFTPPAPAPVAASPTLNITRADLEKMLRDAVLAGQAQVTGIQPVGAAAVVAEMPVLLPVEEFWRTLLGRIRFFDERTERNMHYTAATLYPADTAEDVEV